MSLRHVLYCKYRTINAYNHFYPDVEMWLFPTNVLRAKNGYIYMITLRSLNNMETHIHKCIDVKYLPNIVDEGVCYHTMGVHCLAHHCSYFSPVRTTVLGHMFYDDIPEGIQHLMMCLVREGVSIDCIRCEIAKEYNVIVPPDFLRLHCKNLEMLCKNMQWFDDNCHCSTWLTRDRYCKCKHACSYTFFNIIC